MLKTKLTSLALIGAVLVALATAGQAVASPVTGRQAAVHRVEAYSQDTFVITFRGGESAMVAVYGDGDTDLDLYVYDENGYLIASDTGSTDACLVRFHPRWTGPFRIVVRNLGSVYNVYRIGAA